MMQRIDEMTHIHTANNTDSVASVARLARNRKDVAGDAVAVLLMK